jgi:hypothetical protein
MGDTVLASKTITVSAQEVPMKVLSPNGGETMEAGDIINIDWTSNLKPTMTLTIGLLDKYNQPVQTIVKNTPNSGSYSWAIPRDIVAPGTIGAFKVNVSTSGRNVQVQDSSDAVFNIKGLPVNSSETVKCVFNGSTQTEKCYTDDSRFTCSGAGYCSANVSGVMRSTLTWKSSCGGYAYTTIDGTDEYANFSCAPTGPSITVLKPNGEEGFIAGQNIPAKWQSANIPIGTRLAVISLKNQSTGRSFNVLKNVINDGNEPVPTVGIPAGDYKLAISVVVKGVLVSDESDAAFPIWEIGPNVTLVSTDTDVTAGTGANDDVGLFKIRFKVQAMGDSIYMASPSSPFYSYVIDRNAVPVTDSRISSTLTDVTDHDRTPHSNYLIEEGKEETFELAVSVPLGNGLTVGQYRLSFKSFRWDTQDVYAFNFTKTKVLDDTFRTSYTALNKLPQAVNQVANIHGALEGLLQQLKEILAR